MLKAKISQVKSNLYAVKTTKYDTTDIELTVETADSSPWLNPRFELLGIKPDGHEVHQTENFKVVDLNNHIVQVTLDEQFVTCEGNVDLQLLIKDGSRKSSTPFKLHVGRSLDSDILESHRNVKVLDELEKYIIEGREYISEATGLAQSTANHVQAVNTQAEANEAQRLQNESQRQSAETKRKEAEDDRKQAEVLRVQNEDTRQSAEVIRVANEQTRLENESNRIERETARENKESIRQAQEQKRHNAESIRQSQEATRQSNEDNRKQAEKSRSQEEIIRINNEDTRKQAEDTRQSQELDRQSAESTRQTAETNRNNAESTRTQGENTRKSQETTRQQKETERQSAETVRQQKEVERQSEETKRLEAEELRKEAYIEARQLLDELQDFEPITEKDRTDYMGNLHQTLKEKNDADVDWLLGEINTVHYDGQHITATDTIEGRSKSAILTGQTLVNLLKVNKDNYIINNSQNWSIEDGYLKCVSTTSWHTVTDRFNNMIKPSTKYLIVVEIKENTLNIDINFDGFGTTLGTASTFLKFESNEVGTKKVIVTTPSTIDSTKNGLFRMPINVPNEGSILKFRVMAIEYQDGMENWNIPYFEGMQSVKMPVLTTTGKNLFPTSTALISGKELGDTGGLIHAGGLATEEYIPLTFFEQCVFSSKAAWLRIAFYDIDKKFISINYAGNNKKLIFTPPSGAKFFRVSSGSGGDAHTPNELQYQIEKGTIPTAYEPYKSNILTVNEEVTLRGIGDVHDTLDCLTGELTQNIHESILNGQNDGTIINNNSLGYINYQGYMSKVVTGKNGEELYLQLVYGEFANSANYLLKDGFLQFKGYRPTDAEAEEGLYRFTGSDHAYLYIKTSRFTNHSLDGVKQFLSENPQTYYVLNKPKSIKTVDLSDNHVYSYKGTTHYDCSSAEGSLVPTLSIDVPTNLSALVSRQRETIREQKNQIKLLEETNSELIISQETQDEEIVTNMLASVELFEMVLSIAPLSIDMSKSMEVNPMVEVYVTLILKGEKTIEQVPAVIRDKVQAQLDLLTK